MNNYKKFTFFSFLAITGIFIFIHTSFGAVVLEQPFASTQQPFSNSLRQNLGNSLNSLIIDSGNISLNATSTSQQITITLTQCSIQFGAVGTCTGDESFISSGLLNIPNNFIGIFNFDFTTSTTTILGRYYQITLKSEGAITIPSANGSFGNAYANGKCIIEGIGDCKHIADLYFQLGSNVESETANTSISFNFPTNFLITPDFGNWNIAYDLQATVTPIQNFVANINFGNSTFGTFNNPSGINQFTSLEFLIHKTTALPNGDYFAQAQLYVVPDTGSISDPENSYILATSTTLSFSILSTATTTTDGWTPLALSSLDTIFSGTTATTSLPALETIKEVLSLFKNVFPFNIFYNLQESTVNTLAESVTGTTLGIVLIPKGATSTLLSPTILVDTIGSNLKNKWFTFQNYFFYTMLGIAMYKKIT